MRVKCIKVPSRDSDYVSHLSPGRSYIVYAILFEDGKMKLCIGDDQTSETNMPVWYQSELFEIEDSKIPDSWHMCREDAGFIVSFEEWANSNGEFYYWLVEDREEELRLFKSYSSVLSSLHSTADS